jgi:DNA-binding response OmpR family regulator
LTATLPTEIFVADVVERTRASCWFEDDDLIGSGLEVALRHVSFAVDWAKEGQHAKLALSTTRYDMPVPDKNCPVYRCHR